mgnify:CR=1 FL=1
MQGEAVMWRTYPRELATKKTVIWLGLMLVVIGAVTLDLVFGFFLMIIGMLLILDAERVAANFKKERYVVTNRRAMIVWRREIVKEVPLDTPNLVISTGFKEIGPGVSHVDVVFVANGTELMRFKGVDASRARELFTKLKSMGFPVS